MLNGPSKLALPMGIEPTSPRLNPGVLSQLNYGVIRWTSGAADTGLRKRDSNPRHQTRVRRLSHGEQPPLRFGAITCELRPIEVLAHGQWGDQPDSHRHKRLHGA